MQNYENSQPTNEILEPNPDEDEQFILETNILFHKINENGGIPDYYALAQLFIELKSIIKNKYSDSFYISDEFILYHISEILLTIIQNNYPSTNEAIELLHVISKTSNKAIINDLIENNLFSVLSLLFHQEISENYCNEAFAILINVLNEENIPKFYESFDLSLIHHFLIEVQRDDIKQNCLLLLQKLGYTLPPESFPPIFSFINQIIASSSVSIQSAINYFLIVILSGNKEKTYAIEGLRETGILETMLKIYNDIQNLEDDEHQEFAGGIVFLIVQILCIDPNTIQLSIEESLNIMRKFIDSSEICTGIIHYIFHKFTNTDIESDNDDISVDINRDILNEFIENNGLQIITELLHQSNGNVKIASIYILGAIISEMSNEQVLEYINSDLIDVLIDFFEPIDNNPFIHCMILGIFLKLIESERIIKGTWEIGNKLVEEGFQDTVHDWMSKVSDSRLHGYIDRFEMVVQESFELTSQ